MNWLTQYRFAPAALLVAISSGIAGSSLALLLRFIQHQAYGYESGTFLYGVELASPEQRLSIMLVCGVIAGVGWWLFKEFEIVDILLQIITVGMGSPLGREKAPRELGVLWARSITRRLDLTTEQIELLKACAAGSALAAVYNIPFSGALFALETSIQHWNWRNGSLALGMSWLAVLISWLFLGNEAAYTFPTVDLSISLIVFSILVGPLLGLSGSWFRKASNYVSARAHSDWKTILFCLSLFGVLGALSIYFPALLGNGKSPAELEFESHLGIAFTVVLLILRIFAPLAALKAGANGGTLTPSFANGALIGGLLGTPWAYYWPGSSVHAFALVCATGFLAAAQKLPITAIVLAIEFTHTKPELLLPIGLAVLGASHQKLNKQY